MTRSYPAALLVVIRVAYIRGECNLAAVPVLQLSAATVSTYVSNMKESKRPGGTGFHSRPKTPSGTRADSEVPANVGCFATPAVASVYVAFAAEAKVVLVSEKGREDRASLSEMFLLDCHVDARQRDTHHHRDELPTKVEGCRATSKG